MDSSPLPTTSTQFEQIAMPYVCLDETGTIRHANATAAALLKWSGPHLHGKRLDQFLSPSSQGSLAILLRQTFESRRPQQAELELSRASGDAPHFLMHVTPDGGVCHALLTDVTAYRQAHLLLINERAQQERDLQASASRIRTLNEELEEVLQASQQHLNLLLCRVTNLLGQAQAATTPAATEQHIQSAVQVTAQLTAMLGSLDRYRQTRLMRARLRPVAVSSALKAALSHLGPSLAGRELALTHDTLPTLQTDSQALTLILEEYLSNALKFTRDQSPARIHILHRETPSEHHLGVSDNGVGFNMRQKDQLFRLFGKLHSPKDFEGLGIGLPTVRRTCHRFGARVWAEGKVGQGATFWFAWPKQPRPS
ncbi:MULTISPECIES: ATP-binding protein [unclassified Deinococcus]|uniref:ATP-binding protein n=1 Tax=unclassified Deinococcus TaxID=2623546 RepID=UPI001C2F73D1|nr:MULTISPECIES: ATP-binding protein [unclassified Deinococcus]MDK2014114.1 ATP-binding protein [Deinococcus sp. 43]